MDRELIAIIGGSFLFAFIVLGFSSIPTYFVTRQSCLSKYAEFKPVYGIFAGCRIVWNDKLTPVEIILEINMK